MAICANCLDTGVEIGVYQQRKCSFCRCKNDTQNPPASTGEPCNTCGGKNVLIDKDADGAWDVAPCPDCWGCGPLTKLGSSSGRGNTN
jgi:hypothetical protein